MDSLTGHSVVLVMSTMTQRQYLDSVPFHAEAEGLYGSLLHLDKTAWEGMGCPSKITMTVVPGDTLNEED